MARKASQVQAAKGVSEHGGNPETPKRPELAQRYSVISTNRLQLKELAIGQTQKPEGCIAEIFEQGLARPWHLISSIP